MATHSSTLAWKVAWTEEPGRRQSMGYQRVWHYWATSLSCIGEGNGNPLQCSCLENPRDSKAWWAAIYGVPQSQTRLKRLSSSSSSSRLSQGSLWKKSRSAKHSCVKTSRGKEQKHYRKDAPLQSSLPQLQGDEELTGILHRIIFLSHLLLTLN